MFFVPFARMKVLVVQSSKKNWKFKTLLGVFFFEAGGFFDAPERELRGSDHLFGKVKYYTILNKITPRFFLNNLDMIT
jgi:hypothetical protein